MTSAVVGGIALSEVSKNGLCGPRIDSSGNISIAATG